VEADALVGIGAVVVVPIEQRRRRSAGQRQHIHAERAGDVDLAGGGDEFIRHHAHDGARHNTEELFHRCPALHGADGAVCLLHPAIDDCAQLGHLKQRRFGNARSGHILLDGSELGLSRVVIVFHAVNAAEDFREIDGLDRDAIGFENALGVAHGVEGRGTRADGADLQVLETLHDAANLREPFEISFEFGRGYRLSVERGKRIINAVLHHVVAGAHLAAEAVAPYGDRHVV